MQEEGTPSNREITFSNNEIKYNGNGNLNVLICEATSDNQDKLIVSGNTSNKSKSKTLITSQLKYFEIDNENFATVSLNN